VWQSGSSEHVAVGADAGAAVEAIWNERRGIGVPGAKVTASIVPSSGVGWIDFEWVLGVLVPQRKRMLADWAGRSRAEVVRAVIKMADDWFAHCTEEWEREQAVAALAGPPKPAQPDPWTEVKQQQTLMDRLMRDRLARKAKAASLAESDDADFDALLDEVEGMGMGSAPPYGRQDGVQRVLATLAGGAGLGAPEHPSDGLRDPGDHITEPEV